MAFVHVWNEWLAAGPRDHPVNKFIRASNSTSLQELQRHLEKPRTTHQLMYIDPTDQLTNKMTWENRTDLLALPFVLNRLRKDCASPPQRDYHDTIVKAILDQDTYGWYVCMAISISWERGNG